MGKRAGDHHMQYNVSLISSYHSPAQNLLSITNQALNTVIRLTAQVVIIKIVEELGGRQVASAVRVRNWGPETSGLVDLCPELVKSAPNGTNPGLFQIRFQYIFCSASRSDLKIPDFVSFKI